MKNFDQFIGIDWSGAKQPKHTKAISIAISSPNNNSPVLIKNPHHQYWSRQDAAEFILDLAKSKKRSFIGIDCNFGYAYQIGKQQFGPNYRYIDLWQAVDNSACDDNFFAGGFWQSSDHAHYFWTSGKMPNGFTMPKRTTERACADQGLGHPESPFKLIGAKQVGKGGLAGMRMALYLKEKLGKQICFWPFEDHYDEATIVMSEIYPRQFIKRAGLGNQKLTCETLNAALLSLGFNTIKESNLDDHDTDALISAAGLQYICGDASHVPDDIATPNSLPEKHRLTEGWIFGVL